MPGRGADVDSFTAMWFSFAIIIGALAVALAIYTCLHISRDRYCKTHHPDTTHTDWEEHNNGS